MDYEKSETKENEFRKSLLLVVSGAFCETKLDENNLYFSTNLIMLSFSSVKIAIFNDLEKCERKLLQTALETFKRITFTPKYQKSLWVLIETMNFPFSSEVLKVKFEAALKHISNLIPILVSDVALNGMISVHGNFFINVDILLSIKHIERKKHISLNKEKARILNLIRLVCHITTHLFDRFMLSNFNDNFLLSTPQNSNKYDFMKFFYFEGGYRFEEILFGSCDKVIYSNNAMIEKFFNIDWNNDNIPIFDQADLTEASTVTKYNIFSGVDADVDEFFE